MAPVPIADRSLPPRPSADPSLSLAAAAHAPVAGAMRVKCVGGGEGDADADDCELEPCLGEQDGGGAVCNVPLPTSMFLPPSMPASSFPWPDSFVIEDDTGRDSDLDDE